MRGSTDGKITAGWLDAERSTVIDGEIVPFCRILAGTVSRYVKLGDLYEATLLEVAYYLHPETGELLDNFQFPGSGAPVKVPLYRTGPAKVRFSAQLDEWEENDPAAKGGTSTKFAPKSSIHLQRNVGAPKVQDGFVDIRTNEYGRVYPDKAAPPTIFYREWMIWRATERDVMNSHLACIPADCAYSALSSWRPWMKMGSIKGHTAENGRGGKVLSPEQFPEELLDLIKRKDPDILKDPAAALK